MLDKTVVKMMEDFPSRSERLEESDEQKKEKKKSDLISKKLGELLLLGYRMLNETCDKCQCILMQKKNEPKYCVSCEDSEINKLNNPVEPKPEQKFSIRMDHSTSDVSQARGTGNDQGFDETVHVLKSKIFWAKNELIASNNTTYSIELCQLIKSACEAISSIEKLNINS